MQVLIHNPIDMHHIFVDAQTVRVTPLRSEDDDEQYSVVITISNHDPDILVDCFQDNTSPWHITVGDVRLQRDYAFRADRSKSGHMYDGVLQYPTRLVFDSVFHWPLPEADDKPQHIQQPYTDPETGEVTWVTASIEDILNDQKARGGA